MNRSAHTVISIVFITLVWLCMIPSCVPDDTGDARYVERKDFQQLLDDAKVEGVIAIYEDRANTYYSNSIAESDVGAIPASTFKIPNSIIGLASGTIEGRDHVFLWDGEPRRLKQWEHDMDLRNAYKLSCVPCYQELARNIGVETMKAWLDSLQYPGMVVDSQSIDKFWLEGPSRITPLEQIHFLQRLYREELPLDSVTYAAMKKIMFIHNRDGHVLYGKTGWSQNDDENVGWFVGYIESEENTVAGAVLIRPKPDFDMAEFSAIRKDLMLEAIRKLTR